MAAGASVPVLAEPGGSDCLAASPPGCYSPQQFRAAYDIQPLLDRGIDGQFHLPPAHISVVTKLAGASSPWAASLEEVIDTEIVHAVAPRAALRVVLMPSSPQDTPAATATAMLAALPLAIRDTDVVSFSGALGGAGAAWPARRVPAELRGLVRAY